jgi:hypothetical protein
MLGDLSPLPIPDYRMLPTAPNFLPSPLDEFFVFRMISNPEPNHGISIRDAKGSVVVRNSR